MRRGRLLRIGLIGTAVTAICCFTPVLAWVLVPLGLAAVLGWLDAVLLPLLAVFLGLTGYAWFGRRRAP